MGASDADASSIDYRCPPVRGCLIKSACCGLLMKILQIQTQAEAGGAQRISDVVGAGLRSRGYDVITAFLYRRTAAYVLCNDTAFMLTAPPNSAIDFVRSILRLISYARRWRPDAVLCYQPWGNVAGAITSVACGCRCLIANQNGMPDGLGIPRIPVLLDRFFGSAGIYGVNVVNSAATQAAFSGYPRAYREKIVRVDHGVAKAPARLVPAVARAKFAVPPGSFVIVTAGRLHKQKGQRTLIQSLRAIPDSHLIVAGGGPLGAYLRSLSTAIGVRERVKFVGELTTEEVGDLFSAADVFGFPSVTESFGLAAVEAAIAGVPVVCSDLPALREVLQVNGRSAAVFASPGDPASFAAQINRIREDKLLRVELRGVGAELEKRYSVERMVDGYERLIRNGCHGAQISLGTRRT